VRKASVSQILLATNCHCEIVSLWQVFCFRKSTWLSPPDTSIDWWTIQHLNSYHHEDAPVITIRLHNTSDYTKLAPSVYNCHHSNKPHSVDIRSSFTLISFKQFSCLQLSFNWQFILAIIIMFPLLSSSYFLTISPMTESPNKW